MATRSLRSEVAPIEDPPAAHAPHASDRLGQFEVHKLGVRGRGLYLDGAVTGFEALVPGGGMSGLTSQAAFIISLQRFVRGWGNRLGVAR